MISGSHRRYIWFTQTWYLVHTDMISGLHRHDIWFTHTWYLVYADMISWSCRHDIWFIQTWYLVHADMISGLCRHDIPTIIKRIYRLLENKLNMTYCLCNSHIVCISIEWLAVKKPALLVDVFTKDFRHYYHVYDTKHYRCIILKVYVWVSHLTHEMI